MRLHYFLFLILFSLNTHADTKCEKYTFTIENIKDNITHNSYGIKCPWDKNGYLTNFSHYIHHDIIDSCLDNQNLSKKEQIKEGFDFSVYQIDKHIILDFNAHELNGVKKFTKENCTIELPKINFMNFQEKLEINNSLKLELDSHYNINITKELL